MSVIEPIEFCESCLCDPDNDGQPFELYAEQKIFIREALTLTPAGRLPYPEMLYGAIKKSGKTATAGMMTIYVMVCLAGKYGEAYTVANDLEQAQGRVFKACARILEASPMLADTVKVTASKIEFLETGSIIQAIASDYAGAAGANPNWIVFDELWAYMSEGSRRLWDEMVPVPTRKVSGRLTVTYAGYEDESQLLLELYARGLKGEPAA